MSMKTSFLTKTLTFLPTKIYFGSDNFKYIF